MTKRVLVTGGAGFIGHRVIEELLAKTDYKVISLDRLDTSGTLDRLDYVIQSYQGDDIHQRLDIVWHDLKAAINPYVAERLGDVDIILHLGAGSHVDRSIEQPMEFVLDNVVGTANILDYARSLSKLDLFLYFSTDEVFGPAPKGVFYKEWDRYNSGNPYSATKAGAEELCLAYANTYGLPMAISHTMNVIGHRQNKEKFVPLCIASSLTGSKVSIHANSECTEAGSRHYIDVADVADAVLFLINKYLAGELKRCDKYNIVGSEEIDNEALYNLIWSETSKCSLGIDVARQIPDPNYELVDFHSSRAGHDLRYALCGEKMRKLGWKPRTLRDRIQGIVSWYLENPNWLGVDSE